ncbi:DUF7088 domain-containing protein [Jejuia pallidilutea]|uniref:Gliding motility protein GldF n=1 Tax=Jejuia pallidilutea TaxID=504487 RepID=A0A090WC75_9FLAO|nr:gliding motility protein GldF [Jejuia pallidilutea]
MLLTKPIPHLNIILGKYFGAFVLIAIALLPTLLYVYTVYQLGNPIGNIDFGSTFGSYFGLIFLAGAYTAIGIFCSTLSNNQIVSFIISVFICFMFYIGFEGITAFTSSTIVEQFGMNYHYKSLSRGVIDTRDIIYFLSVIVFFILLTKLGVKTGKANLKDIIKIAIVFSVILVLNTISNYAYKRFDVTKDQRYTLSNSAKEIATKANSPLIVDVFLKGEDFPSEFRRLQTETRQLLEEFSNVNHNIVFQFINLLKTKPTGNKPYKY